MCALTANAIPYGAGYPFDVITAIALEIILVGSILAFNEARSMIRTGPADFGEEDAFVIRTLPFPLSFTNPSYQNTSNGQQAIT